MIIVPTANRAPLAGAGFHDPLKLKPVLVLMGLLCFSIPFSVSVFPGLIVHALAIGAIVFSLPALRRAPAIDRKLTGFLLFLLAPSIVGAFSLFPSLVINSHSLDYGELFFLGRIVNLILFASIILLVHRQVVKQHSAWLFKWLWWGGAVFVFFGIWHAASIYGLPTAFPFETRSHVHGARGLESLGAERVTGVAEEPSYFGAVVVDFMILTMLLVRSRPRRFFIVLLGTMLIILSLSPSNFLILAGAIGGGLATIALRAVLRLKLSGSTVIYGGLGFLCVLLLAFGFSNTSIWEYVLLRLETIDQTGRFYMNVMPFIWSLDSNVFSFVFGNGIKTYAIIGTQYLLPSGGPVHVTSNNVFVDMFWEAGLAGLLLLIAFYVYCFSRIVVSRFSVVQVFLSGAILSGLFFSGFVRADFASLRVFMMFYLLFLLTHHDMRSFGRHGSARW